MYRASLGYTFISGRGLSLGMAAEFGLIEHYANK
jgi:hypothetical protein